MTNHIQTISRGALTALEARLLTAMGPIRTFTVAEACQALATEDSSRIRQSLSDLTTKGWTGRIKRGLYAILPLSSGAIPSPQLHEFLVAMELVTPAAIAYWSALNYHGLTEQTPRTVFVATDHPVNHRRLTAVGFSFRLVSIRREKFFGLQQQWIDERPFTVTDPEKTLVDGLDLPQYVGGVPEIVKAIASYGDTINESRLRHYARQIGNSAVGKRLGYIMERLGAGDVDALMNQVPRRTGYTLLDPTQPAKGPYCRRWGLRINMEIAP